LSYVVDASIVVAWFIPGEPWTVKARKLRDEYAEGLVRLYAPNILVYELNNSLRKAVRRNLIDFKVASSCIEAFSKITPELLPLSLDEQRKALKIAVDEGITFYDSAYIVITQATGSTLVSADLDLASVARKYVNTILVRELP